MFERAEAWGLLKGNDGLWLGGFSYNIDLCSVIETELWAIIRLEFAWQNNCSKIVVEFDSKLAVRW